MIDLETLGTKPDCQVLSIGAVKFDANSNEEPYAEFYKKFTLDDQEELGRTVDESTIEWWNKQSKTVIEEAFSLDDREETADILKALNKWLVGVDIIWAQGAVFDIAILESMYRMYDLPVPWPFWKIKDSRTLMSIASSDPRKNYKFDAHNALADAFVQAKCVQDVVAEYSLSIRK